MLQVLVRHCPTDRINSLSTGVTRQIADIDEIPKEAIVWAGSPASFSRRCIGGEYFVGQGVSPFFAYFFWGVSKCKTGEETFGEEFT